MKFTKLMIVAVLSALAFTACSDDPETPRSEVEYVDGVGTGGDIAGFYVLNEGNMGSNKSSLDYFDYESKTYTRNIYAERNPDMLLELGDSGNDIAIYRNRLYISLTGSHKVEVLDARTAIRVGQLNVDSPRSFAFDGDYVYISSFVGGIDGNGSVVKYDVNTLQKVGTCSVGMGPEEMVVDDGKLYVANSTVNTNYDNRISVIDLSTFTVSHSIVAGVNMRRLRLDSYGNMWATASGNYADISASLVLLKKTDGEYAKVREYEVSCENLTFGNNMMYYYTVVYDAAWNATNAYFKNNVDAAGMVGNGADFITDGTESTIATPYCIMVQPSDGSVIITDANNYVSSGVIRCYSPDGKLQWQAKTGDIPGHIAFLKK